MARITFLGAAETVTGSRHLLTVDRRKFLVDCGLFQGSRALRERNWENFGFEPRELDAIILTHAHMDHCGLVPRLVKQGFTGPIYASRGTCAIARVSLPDSGRLQEEEARHANKHGWSRHKPAMPLYTEREAYQALKQLEPISYEQFVELSGGSTFRFYPAGHILGSAFAEFYFPSGERILMSGDLGRYNRPILKDPTPIDYAEHLVIESTYGDRDHSDEDPRQFLVEACRDISDRPGALIIPSFAIGRTQELLYYLRELQDTNRIPKIPIFLDSPMATRTTLLTVQHDEDHDRDMRMSLEDERSPIQPASLTFVRDRHQSKELNRHPGPLIIISGSGMCTGGRIVHHLINRLGNPKTIVLFTGYQAAETPGRALIDGATTFSAMSRTVEVKASIRRLNSLSAHADRKEIEHWLGNFRTPPRTTFLVHGEPPAQQALADRLRERLGWEIVIPKLGQSFDLSPEPAKT